tara:strand:- start:109 stop:489 length:381 start_codon:yes stop_codon:yes gene_type:complete
MTKLNQVWKCEMCGNIVELVHSGAGELVCCGVPMELQVEKSKEEGKEKHVPVVEELDNNKFKITVGSTPHPMEKNHFIEWIEVVSDEVAKRHPLKPGQTPEVISYSGTDNYYIRAYCNIHGLWSSK